MQLPHLHDTTISLAQNNGTALSIDWDSESLRTRKWISTLHTIRLLSVLNAAINGSPPRRCRTLTPLWRWVVCESSVDSPPCKCTHTAPLVAVLLIALPQPKTEARKTWLSSNSIVKQIWQSLFPCTSYSCGASHDASADFSSTLDGAMPSYFRCTQQMVADAF